MRSPSSRNLKAFAGIQSPQLLLYLRKAYLQLVWFLVSWVWHLAMLFACGARIEIWIPLDFEYRLRIQRRWSVHDKCRYESGTSIALAPPLYPLVKLIPLPILRFRFGYSWCTASSENLLTRITTYRVWFNCWSMTAVNNELCLYGMVSSSTALRYRFFDILDINGNW